jgi:hypothetical protein
LGDIEQKGISGSKVTGPRSKVKSATIPQYTVSLDILTLIVKVNFLLCIKQQRWSILMEGIGRKNPEIKNPNSPNFHNEMVQGPCVHLGLKGRPYVDCIDLDRLKVIRSKSVERKSLFSIFEVQSGQNLKCRLYPDTYSHKDRTF